MRFSFFCLLVVSVVVIYSCDDPDHLTIKNAIILNAENGEMEKVNILIADGIIQKITSDTLRNSNFIDLKGNLMISPLWDMHAHLHENAEEKISDFGNYGIRGIRDMGIFKTDEFNVFKEFSSNISDKPLDYKIFPVGYIYNGSECEVEEHQTISSRSDLIEAIAMIKSANLNFFKIHNCFPITLLNDLVEICSENNIKIVGHIPQGISPLKFTEYQISSIEHMDSFLRGLFAQEHPVSTFGEAIEILDGSYLDSIAINMKSSNTYITPTLVTYENFVKSFPEDQQEMGISILKKLQSYTKRLWESDVKILAGTDYPLGELEAGKSLIRELELLVESGIPVNEVLKIATQNPLEYLGFESWKIEEGSPVNFLVVNIKGNVIENLKEAKAIVFDGKETSLMDISYSFN